MIADPEKKKYFRIQPSHKATPGTQYSKDSVKRKRIEHDVGFLILPRDMHVTDNVHRNNNAKSGTTPRSPKKPSKKPPSSHTRS